MWLDNRLRLNASGFYLDWNDLIIETLSFTVPSDPTSILNVAVNVSEAEAYGFEMEMVSAPKRREESQHGRMDGTACSVADTWFILRH